MQMYTARLYATVTERDTNSAPDRGPAPRMLRLTGPGPQHKRVEGELARTRQSAIARDLQRQLDLAGSELRAARARLAESREGQERAESDARLAAQATEQAPNPNPHPHPHPNPNPNPNPNPVAHVSLRFSTLRTRSPVPKLRYYT